MKGRLTKAGYRCIDLTLFAVMLFVFEGIVTLASTQWFPGEPYAVSVAALVTALVMMRWGPWAAIHTVLGGIVSCVFSGAESRQYLIYCVGNLGALAALGLKKKMGDEAIRADVLKTLLFGLAAVWGMDAGRALTALALGWPPSVCAGFFTTDVITLLFTLVLLWIVRRLDGVFENQHHYLLRVQQEQEAERGGLR